MHVISFVEHIWIENSHMHFGSSQVFEGGKAYLFADKQFDKMKAWDFSIPYEKVSKAEPMFTPFHFSPNDSKKRVIIYNGVGGMGDQIMTWPLSKILADRGYEVHILSEPHLTMFWHGFPWIKSIVTLPCYWSTMEQFDYHINLEYISNGYAHGGQMQPIDLMLRTCGIDPKSISDEEKRVAPHFSKMETDIAKALYADRRLGFYQLACSQQVRSLPPKQSRAVLKALAEAFPDIYWIGVYGPLESSGYWMEPLGVDNVEFRSFERPRLMWSLIKRAEICVSPDSMLVHVAGVLERPCVGLWGPYGPGTRVQYYPNHYPIHHTTECSFSPCHWNAVQFPHICPPLAQQHQRCAVMLKITPEEVVEGARKLMEEAKSKEAKSES
jgi:hypothetical protein